MREYIVDSLVKGMELRRGLLEDSDFIADMERVARQIYETFKQGNKVLLCGNGGSAADAQHIAAEFVGRFETERKGWPAIALTTDTSVLTSVGNDYGMERIFCRQVEALGQKGDILIAITTSGNSNNVYSALEAAKARGLITIGFLGGTGGICCELCDYRFIINSSVTARIQELHITIGHILCGLIDKMTEADE